MENKKEIFVCCECMFKGYCTEEEIKAHQDTHRPKDLNIFVKDSIRMKESLKK